MITLKNVGFNYDTPAPHKILNNINFHIKKGEVVVFCGESGCGKTTLIRLINGLIPNYYSGDMSGQVLVNGMDVSRAKLYETSKFIGSVFQNPKSQFFNVDTTSELAFGSENQGINEEEILRRMTKAIRDFDMEDLIGRDIFKLSGGEKQKVACASVSTSCPDVFVLDEPSSNLDHHAIEDLAKCIALWKAEGKTIVIAEHRLHYLKGIADKYVYLKDGQVMGQYTPKEMMNMSFESLSGKGLRALVKDQLKAKNVVESKCESLILSDFIFGYKKNEPILNIPKLEIPKGLVTGIVGHNGAGKSTFAKCLCGLNKKFKGKVNIGNDLIQNKELINNVYMVMQDTGHQLFTECVEDEVALSLKSKTDDPSAQIRTILESLDLLDQKDMHPMALSGGQKQRVAVASAKASERQIIIFDEPTSGLDFKHMKQVAQTINDLKASGKTILIITHDLEFILACCDHIVQLEKGKVVKNFRLDQAYESGLVEYYSHYGQQVG